MDPRPPDTASDAPGLADYIRKCQPRRPGFDGSQVEDLYSLRSSVMALATLRTYMNAVPGSVGPTTAE